MRGGGNIFFFLIQTFLPDPWKGAKSLEHVGCMKRNLFVSSLVRFLFCHTYCLLCLFIYPTPFYHTPTSFPRYIIFTPTPCFYQVPFLPDSFFINSSFLYDSFFIKVLFYPAIFKLPHILSWLYEICNLIFILTCFAGRGYFLYPCFVIFVF